MQSVSIDYVLSLQLLKALTYPDLCRTCKEQLIRFLNGSYSYDESEEDSEHKDSKKDKQHEQVATQEELLSGILRLWDSYFGTLKP
jgi:hypothetical protein